MKTTRTRLKSLVWSIVWALALASAPGCTGPTPEEVAQARCRERVRVDRIADHVSEHVGLSREALSSLEWVRPLRAARDHVRELAERCAEETWCAVLSGMTLLGDRSVTGVGKKLALVALAAKLDELVDTLAGLQQRLELFRGNGERLADAARALAQRSNGRGGSLASIVGHARAFDAAAEPVARDIVALRLLVEDTRALVGEAVRLLGELPAPIRRLAAPVISRLRRVTARLVDARSWCIERGDRLAQVRRLAETLTIECAPATYIDEGGCNAGHPSVRGAAPAVNP